MAFWILIIFISIPLIEIALFIQVGGFIGLWPTIAIVIITAILGTFLIRKQGLSTLQRAQNELEKKQIPIRELFEGLCLIFSGALLLTPGFLTDVIGFVLLVPSLRGILGGLLWKTIQNTKGIKIEMSDYKSHNIKEETGPIVEGEAFEITDEENKENDKK